MLFWHNTRHPIPTSPGHSPSQIDLEPDRINHSDTELLPTLVALRKPNHNRTVFRLEEVKFLSAFKIVKMPELPIGQCNLFYLIAQVERLEYSPGIRRQLRRGNLIIIQNFNNKALEGKS